MFLVFLCIDAHRCCLCAGLRGLFVSNTHSVSVVWSRKTFPVPDRGHFPPYSQRSTDKMTACWLPPLWQTAADDKVYFGLLTVACHLQETTPSMQPELCTITGKVTEYVDSEPSFPTLLRYYISYICCHWATRENLTAYFYICKIGNCFSCRLGRFTFR